MKAPLLSCSLLATTMLSALPASADISNIQISGYGSIVAGQTFDSDEIFTADWHDVGQYTDSISFKPESMIALQGRGSLTDKLSFTAQLVAKGVDDFEPEFDWYYLTYEASDNLSLMAGRRTIPMYYFSEFYEVGFAYPWIRPPANLYWWQINFFNGFHATYSFSTGELDHSITAFYGNEDDSNNKEISSLYGRGFERVRENWQDITGFNWVISGSFYDLRFVHFTTDRDRIYYNGTSVPTTPSEDAQFRSGKYAFYGVGGSAQFDNLGVYFDYNYVATEDSLDRNVPVNTETDYPTFLVTLTYNIGDFQPFISYSKADQKTTNFDPVTGQELPRAPGQAEDDYEQHVLTSVGLRYSVGSNTSFKVQYDNFDDQGYTPQGWDFHGDSKSMSVGIDFIF